MGAHGFGGGDHLFVRGVLVAVANVVGHGAREQVGFLEYHTHLADQGMARHVSDVVPVHADAAVAHVGEPVDQRHQRALTGAGGADQGHILAGLDMEVHALQYINVGYVVEVHVLELDLTLDLG